MLWARGSCSGTTAGCAPRVLAAVSARPAAVVAAVLLLLLLVQKCLPLLLQ